jgi:hypothetical protein
MQQFSAPPRSPSTERAPTDPPMLTDEFQNAIRQRLIAAGYETTAGCWLSLHRRWWGVILTIGQRIGISVGGPSNPDAIYIVVSGPDAQRVRRLLKPFERRPVKVAVRRQRKPKRAWYNGTYLASGCDDKQELGYCYHGTSRHRLRRIARKGLEPHAPREGEGPWDDPDRADWLPGEEEEAYEGRVFATMSFDVASGYIGGDRDGVMLRMPSDLGWLSNGAYLYLLDPIEPESIEVLWEDGNWHPLLAIVATLPMRRRLTTILGIKFVKE